MIPASSDPFVGESRQEPGVATSFSLNRNKKSIVLNLKAAEGKKILARPDPGLRGVLENSDRTPCKSWDSAGRTCRDQSPRHLLLDLRLRATHDAATRTAAAPPMTWWPRRTAA